MPKSVLKELESC